jgi:predicted P-loop ATPase
LHELGLIERIARAGSLIDLRKITFNPNTADVDLIIRDALRPTTGAKAWFFDGLREGALKRILKNRFDDMKADREAELRHGGHQGGGQQSAPDWTADLQFDKKGNIRPSLSNLTLYLRHHPDWQGVLAYDEFSARAAMREPPPWGEEAPDAPFNDHHESLTRIWFQREHDIHPGLGDMGRAVQAAARNNPFHPVKSYLESLIWNETPRLDTGLTTYFHAEDTEYIRAIRLSPIA